LVFISGEAGVGKTALVRRFADSHADAVRVLSGACDALFTPRPLGPILDLASITGGELGALAARGGRPYEVADALIAALRSGPPAMLVLEDIHWADEATLDVLRLLARRIESVPALVLVTYRDDLDRAHPLRILLGELPKSAPIARLPLGALSAEAVATLAEPSGMDATDLYAKTAGNPFYVTEVLAAGDATIPATVRDAVLARAARLSTASMAVLEAVAIVPAAAELWLLEGLVGPALEGLDACLSAGMLTATAGAVTFRHELARLAIDASLTPVRKMSLHRQALSVLVASPRAAPDLARLVHHADGAADAEAVMRWAPAAAERAATLGAHREATAQYAAALRYAAAWAPAERGELLERQAHESYLADLFDISISSGREAVEFEAAGAGWLREGAALRQLSHHLRCTGRPPPPGRRPSIRVSVLEQLAPGRTGVGLGNGASISMNADDGVAVAPPGALALASNSTTAKLSSTRSTL
jgi:hypothetical protein